MPGMMSGWSWPIDSVQSTSYQEYNVLTSWVNFGEFWLDESKKTERISKRGFLGNGELSNSGHSQKASRKYSCTLKTHFVIDGHFMEFTPSSGYSFFTCVAYSYVYMYTFFVQDISSRKMPPLAFTVAFLFPASKSNNISRQLHACRIFVGHATSRHTLSFSRLRPDFSSFCVVSFSCTQIVPPWLRPYLNGTSTNMTGYDFGTDSARNWTEAFLWLEDEDPRVAFTEAKYLPETSEVIVAKSFSFLGGYSEQDNDGEGLFTFLFFFFSFFFCFSVFSVFFFIPFFHFLLFSSFFFRFLRLHQSVGVRGEQAPCGSTYSVYSASCEATVLVGLYRLMATIHLLHTALFYFFV